MLKNDIAALAPMPDDPILGLVSLYQADERPNKVNLGVGVYLNEAGKVPLLEVVEEAERRMTNRHQPRTYMPMSGLPASARIIRQLPPARLPLSRRWAAPAHCSWARRLRISSWAFRNPSYRIRPGAITLRFSRLTVSLSASIRTFRLTARRWILMP